MNHTAAVNTTAVIVAQTIQHMANEAGISAEDTLKAILAGGNAQKRFDAYMKLALETMAAR